MNAEKLKEIINSALASGMLCTIRSECDRLNVTPTYINTRIRDGMGYEIIRINGRMMLINLNCESNGEEEK
jgi:hypothetical protein